MKLHLRQRFVIGFSASTIPSISWTRKGCLAHLKKNVSTHTFRHTCATHMLKNGAPVRRLQKMLGQAFLESTQIYTHVTINDLKEIHAKYHPDEKMKGRGQLK
jgi:site-specific recombinase XerC